VAEFRHLPAAEVEEKTMHSDLKGTEVAEARRRFLTKCGQFAAVTPPAISLLLAASRSNYAVAASGSSGGGGGGNGFSIAGNSPTNGNSGGGGNGGDSNNNNPTNGTFGSRSCGNTFDALFNNDKCIR
jgi:hypothetical protein